MYKNNEKGTTIYETRSVFEITTRWSVQETMSTEFFFIVF